MAEKTASTQEQLDILDIKEDLVLLKSGGAAVVIQTNAVNFDLLSEKEQDAMIAAYATLLNSLPSHIQVVIRSRKLDISTYLKKIDLAAKSQPNPYLLKKISSYKDFIKGLVQKGEVLDKRFFMIIPYHEGTLLPSSPLDSIRRFLGMASKPKRVDRAGLLRRAKTDLEPKREHLIKQLSRLGIKAKQLTSPELAELFYEIYNPRQAKLQHLEKETALSAAPLVEPATIALRPAVAETQKKTEAQKEGGPTVEENPPSPPKAYVG